MDIEFAYVSKQKRMRATPKDADSRRAPLSAKAIEIVGRASRRPGPTEGCGVPHIDGSECASVLVFRNQRGGVWHPELLSRYVRQAARELGMKPKSAYALRRGFATRAIEGGADVFQVQRVMGHADLDELAGYVQGTPTARAKPRLAARP